MKYDLEIGQVVYFKCKVIELLPNCIVMVSGVNVGDKTIKFMTHPNSLIKKIQQTTQKEERKMGLKTLEEHNKEREDLYKKLCSYPKLNGIACPKCGKELMDSDAMMLTSMPLRRNIHCSNSDCDFTGDRVD